MRIVEVPSGCECMSSYKAIQTRCAHWLFLGSYHICHRSYLNVQVLGWCASTWPHNLLIYAINFQVEFIYVYKLLKWYLLILNIIVSHCCRKTMIRGGHIGMEAETNKIIGGISWIVLLLKQPFNQQVEVWSWKISKWVVKAMIFSRRPAAQLAFSGIILPSTMIRMLCVGKGFSNSPELVAGIICNLLFKDSCQECFKQPRTGPWDSKLSRLWPFCAREHYDCLLFITWVENSIV